MPLSLFTAPTPLTSRNWNNLRVGILGGTFNPPHEGHIHIANAALKWLDLDFVWWMVAPQNPHKQNSSNNTPFEKRFGQCLELVKHPKMIVTDIERYYNGTCSFDTVCNLKRDFTKTDFIWIGGTDLVNSFHLWEGWQDLVSMIPFSFIHRPPSNNLIKSAPITNSHFRHIHMNKPVKNCDLSPSQIYWIKKITAHPESSTRIRNT